jgi:hypothetical protein
MEVLMIESYNQLTDQQKLNIDFFLKKAQGNHLDYFKREYGVSSGRSLDQFRQNIINFLIIEQIPFYDFMDRLSHVYLEGNNTLFVYEPKDPKVFEQNPIETLLDKFKITEQLYNLDPQTFKNEMKIVNVFKPLNRNQVIFTIAAPSQIQVKNIDGVELKKDIYLAYFIMDYDLKHFVLSMHPTEYLVSILGEPKKRELDTLTWLFLHNFRKQVVHFEVTKPDWIVDALCLITEEYFHHNNPTIVKKMEIYQDKVSSKVLRLLKVYEESFKREDIELRLERAISTVIENELVEVYSRKKKELPFDIFLQQSDKGVTEFRANSKGKAFSHAEAAEIVRLMWEHGDIVSLGIIHKKKDNEVERLYPYIASLKDKYYSLKRTTVASTDKEVVDDVLRKLNQYKQKVRPASGATETFGHRIDNSEAE